MKTINSMQKQKVWFITGASRGFGFEIARAVLPYMRQQHAGHIINISSVGGLKGYVGWGLYGSTRFAVEGITEALALEVAPPGIHATVVAPGFFRTDFLEGHSRTRTANVIDGYATTVGAMRDFATQVSLKQAGARHRPPGRRTNAAGQRHAGELPRKDRAI